MADLFPPYSGPGCPKCGGTFVVFWHEQGFLDWESGLVAMRPCHEVAGWPQGEGGAVEPEDRAEEEHLHRACMTCGYQAIEAVATPEQRVPRRRYELIYGLKSLNERAALGWRVVSALMPGPDIVALMELPQ